MAPLTSSTRPQPKVGFPTNEKLGFVADPSRTQRLRLESWMRDLYC
jgi:hypothetical protein